MTTTRTGTRPSRRRDESLRQERRTGLERREVEDTLQVQRKEEVRATETEEREDHDQEAARDPAQVEPSSR